MIKLPSKKSVPKKKTTAKKPAKKQTAEKKSRVRNPEQTRAKLLQATIDLLAEKGPDALSLKEAARVANVSRGVAYQHFEDRDHLLREAKLWMSDRLLDFARDIQPALKKKNVSQVLNESVSNVAKLVLNNREAARLLITDALAGKALDSAHPLYQMVVSDLESLKASGHAREDMDIEVMHFIMLGAVAILIMLSHLPDADGTDSLAQRFVLEWTRLLREGMFVRTNIERAQPSIKPQPSPAKPKLAAKPKVAAKSRTKTKSRIQ